MQQLISFLLIAGLSCSLTARAQSDSARAREKGMAAIQLMDNGEPAKAIPLLEEAAKLDPGNINYPYEKAFALYQMKDFDAVISLGKKMLKHKDVMDKVYQLLGNAYDYTGKREKALDVYEKGLKAFPHSGPLYLERGVMELAVKEYNKALSYFETGIEADPQFPSNYYWAARLFLESDDEVWGMIYGELFTNLERGSKRTEEISKLLYYTYKSEIKFTSDTSTTISFSKNNTINISIGRKGGPDELLEQLKAIKMPFGVGVYEPTLLVAISGEKIINLASLDRIRTRFLDAYQQFGHQEKHPVVLFDYHRKIREAGHLEAYNYWLLGQGSQQEFDDWRIAHRDQWSRFMEWYKEHPIRIEEENKFVRSDY